MTWQTGGLREIAQYIQCTVYTRHRFKIHINIFIDEYKQPYWYFNTNIILKMEHTVLFQETAPITLADCIY